jgi:hypothetical protein
MMSKLIKLILQMKESLFFRKNEKSKTYYLNFNITPLGFLILFSKMNIKSLNILINFICIYNICNYRISLSEMLNIYFNYFLI